MTNNYIFQKLMSTFDLSRNHDLTAKVFELGGQRQAVTKSLIKAWRTHDRESRHFKPMPDNALEIFLNGLQEASKQKLIVIYLSEVDNE